MQKKLWQTSSFINPIVEKFTVGDDYVLDTRLISYDIIGSLAHAKMLESIGVISSRELLDLEKGLNEILVLSNKWEFQILKNQEDCHTAIEQYLTEHYGEVGKKIHTGRSRNDQVLTMLRLFMKDLHIDFVQEIEKLVLQLSNKASEFNNQKMPGYTHAQRAMPTTVGKWIDSYAAAIRDQLSIFSSIWNILDQSPLGSAAGFGIDSFPNNRSMTSELMGFWKIQENPLYCGISRGLFEYNFLSTLSWIIMLIGRMNNDFLLFTMQEFRFMSLPETMTTGSSIMPQKRNYDLCELMRGNIPMYLWQSDQLRNIYIHLMSGYQRDLQLTKKIFIDATDLAKNIIEIFSEIINNLQIHTEILDSAMTDELYATERVYELVRWGMSFRDAYLEVKNTLFQ